MIYIRLDIKWQALLLNCGNLALSETGRIKTQIKEFPMISIYKLKQ